MIAGAHGIFGETRAKCGRLCRIPDNRLAWGCDARAPSPLFRGTCWKCMGGDPGCEECEGFGEAYFRRCPNGIQDDESREFFRVYSWLERGVLPSGATLEEQPATFVEAVRILENERALIMEAKRDG